MSGGACVIVNPASGRGRGSRALPAVRQAFAAVGITDIRVTEAPGDERRLAACALEEGCSTIVAAGGDGTWSNVANAILTAGADCRLGLLALGTGNDFAKTVGAPARDPVATARLVAGDDTHEMRVDVGCIEERYFLNIAGFGLDIAVLEDIARITWLRGDALYLYAALRHLFTYPGMEIDVGTRGAARGASPHLLLIVANAKHFGGSFRIAPHASLTDGQLDAIAIGHVPPMRRLALFGAATRGTHVTRPEVCAQQAPSFVLRFPTPPAYETDGEYRQARTNELEVRCVPAALRVITPAAGAPPA
ncbi:MAG TPA: diacylglycerol kinase family protein [Gemmatimonadaceae bacterium]|nr:diacylglycerol kinase family protein [Gemmatimonadaceae bacterium]